MKTIYIPGFGNNEDKIFQNYLEGEGDIVQLNLKNISSKQLSSFTKGKSFEEIFGILKKHYPDIDKGILKQLIEEGTSFKGFTRKVSTTISLTATSISKIIDHSEQYKIVGHSQGGLIAMKTILENPQLLNNLKEIHLLAPVIDFETGGNFHKGKKSGYINGKGVIVRPQYIGELQGDNSLLYELLDMLSKASWQGVLKLKIGKLDKVIPIEKFNIDKIKSLYPKIELEIVEGDHYLGYK